MNLPAGEKPFPKVLLRAPLPILLGDAPLKPLFVLLPPIRERDDSQWPILAEGKVDRFRSTAPHRRRSRPVHAAVLAPTCAALRTPPVCKNQAPRVTLHHTEVAQRRVHPVFAHPIQPSAAFCWRAISFSVSQPRSFSGSAWLTTGTC